MMSASNPCPVCGSRLFYEDNGEIRCAKHQPPADSVGKQFILKSKHDNEGADMSKQLNKVDWAKFARSVRKRTGHHVSEKEARAIAEKAVSEASAETLVESHLASRPTMADAVKNMTTSGLRVREGDRFLRSDDDRDMFGRAEKSRGEDDGEEDRDFYGRKKRRSL